MEEAVNFFDSRCRSESSNEEFGLCDEQAPSMKPAYINEDQKDDWIGIVRNPDQKLAEFYAIDHCVEILRDNGSPAKKCDGLLKSENNLVFVELKDRANKHYFRDGRRQLTETINFFKQFSSEEFDSVRGHLCNKQRPMSRVSRAEGLQKFLDETGCLLMTTQVIDI